MQTHNDNFMKPSNGGFDNYNPDMEYGTLGSHKFPIKPGKRVQALNESKGSQGTDLLEDLVGYGQNGHPMSNFGGTGVNFDGPILPNNIINDFEEEKREKNH